MPMLLPKKVLRKMPLTPQKATVGKITFSPSPSDLLGLGSNGTSVYRGKLQGSREVAVKRMLREHNNCFQKEVEALTRTDKHPNVIQYFCYEEDATFYYIALEKCVGTLRNWVEPKTRKGQVWPKALWKLDRVTLLSGVTDGLAFIHSKGIVHRDMKPENVLLTEDGRVLISDFGLCKTVPKGERSCKNSEARGTEGWRAPEVCKNGKIMSDQSISFSQSSFAADVFSLGCLYYYVLSGGHHPFGKEDHRQSNIAKNNYHPKLSEITDNPRGAATLIKRMISRNPKTRPDLPTVLRHPLFWTNEKLYNFLEIVSDWLEESSGADVADLKTNFDKNGGLVVMGNWMDRLSDDVKESLCNVKYRKKYDGASLRDLLRAVRNTKHHRNKMSMEAQASLGGGEMDGFVTFWLGRFPKLLPHTWEAMRGASIPGLQEYY